MKVNRLLFALAFLGTSALSMAASDPRSQALALYRGIQKQNWRTLYYLAAFSPVVRKQLSTPDAFAADVQKGLGQSGNAAVVKQLFESMRNIQVGKATIKGNKATVPTSVDIVMSGQKKHFKGVAKMVLDRGVWKWDLAYTNDVETATATRLKELIGTPSN